MDIKVSAKGSNVLVDFGDMLVEIPTGVDAQISNVKLGVQGLIVFNYDGGVKDFLSIPVVAFGHEPSHVPWDYKILEDKNGKGVAGFNHYAKLVREMKGKDVFGRLYRGRKASYEEILMILGDVICARADESGELQIKIYNDYGKPYIAYYGLGLDREIRLIRSSYPDNQLMGITKLLSNNLKIIYEWADRKKVYKSYKRKLRNCLKAQSKVGKKTR